MDANGTIVKLNWLRTSVATPPPDFDVWDDLDMSYQGLDEPEKSCHLGELSLESPTKKAKTEQSKLPRKQLLTFTNSKAAAVGSASKQTKSTEIQETPLSPSCSKTPKKKASSLMSASEARRWPVSSPRELQRTPDEDATAQRDDFLATKTKKTEARPESIEPDKDIKNVVKKAGDLSRQSVSQGSEVKACDSCLPEPDYVSPPFPDSRKHRRFHSVSAQEPSAFSYQNKASADVELPSSLSQRKVFLTFDTTHSELLTGPHSPETGHSDASFALPPHSSRSTRRSHLSRYSLCSSLDFTATRRHSDVNFPSSPFTRSVKPCRRLSEGGEPSWVTPSSLDKEIGFIDSHCHLDMLYGKLGYRGSFGCFQDQFSGSFPSEFRGCVANFCNPRLTVKEAMWGSLLSEDSVWGAFGCHPHFAKEYSDSHERSILAAMRHPKAVAFGEMGLDYSHKNSTRPSRQKEVLERQLHLAVAMQKPLVIHCRDADEDLLEIMKRCVPWDYKIHRHCFTNAYRVIQPFLTHFPNLYVGFTALITYPNAAKPRAAVRKIPLSRIVVETDAPYFRPKQVARDVCQFAHPGMGIHTLREISLLKGVDLTTVFTTIRDNTVQLYGL